MDLRPRLLAAAAALLAAAAPVRAAPDVDQVRGTTSRLINLLVEQGVLTRARADTLLKELDAPATPSAAAASPRAAGEPAAPVRVPYVPAFVRQEIKDELRAEIAAQGLREGWAGPGAVPAWVRGLRVDGDLRTRLQSDMYGSGNAPAVSVADTNRNRAITPLNTTEDRQRLRVRARLGLTATADESWSAGLRLTTGSTTDPLSSNQTLGNYGNRFTVAFDRAYVRYRWGDSVNAVFGRFGNPWFGTDLVWANDLGFDGVALQWTPAIGSSGWRGFVTAAAMPVQEVELSTADKWLYGLQAGFDTPANAVLRGKLGLAYYAYQGLVGKANAPGSSLNDFTAPAFVQKGNTYFNISSDPARPLLALASDYRIVNLTGALTMELASGKHLVLTGDYAKNIGFDRAAVAARTGVDVSPETTAYLVRAAFGDAEITKRHDWQLFFGYRHVERDAVLDAFTDSDMRLGGTDVKGWLAGGSYGLGRNTMLTLRWLSGEAIAGAPLGIDTVQLDLSLRF